MPEAEKKVSVNITKSVPVKSTSIDDIRAAASKVGAPNTAQVSTQSSPGPYPGIPVDPATAVEEVLPYTLTFTWTEEV